MFDSDPESSFELTATQMAIWLDQALHPGKPIYNTGQVLSLKTDIELVSFEEALTRVISENDALRLRFSQRGTRIIQHVMDGAEHSLDTRDFTMEVHPEESARMWLKRIFWESVSPFDFPLFKFALAKVSDRHFLWLQRYHHLIIDATGRQLVAARVATIYDALRAGKLPPNAKSASYRIAKDAEDDYLSSDEYANDEAYWKTRFSDLPEPLVPTAVQLTEKLRSGLAARVDCGLTSRESAGLRQFAREYDSSPFKVILTIAWSCFSRLYSTTDLIFGVPLAGRSNAEHKSAVGLFAKVMPFRLRLDSALTLRAAMKALDGHLSEDLRHQRFPTDHISRLLQLRRLKRAGLHEIGVNYVRSNYAFEIGGSPVACSTLSTGFSLPWGITAFEFGERDTIRLIIEYDRGRIRPEVAERLGGCLRTLLSAVSEFVDTPLGQMPMELDTTATNQSSAADQVDGTTCTVLGMEYHDKLTSRLPLDHIEIKLLEIWRRQLNANSIGVDDDYFDLGGDSLKAVMLVGECSDQFGIKLPLSVLFESPTVARMAEVIRKSPGSAPASRLISLRTGSGGPPLLLLHPIGGSIFCYADLVACMQGPCPIYGLQAAGLEHDERLPQSIEEMAHDYLHSAETIIGKSAIHLAGWSFGGLVAAEMARQLVLTGRTAASVTLIDTPARRERSGEENEGEILRLAAGALGTKPNTLAISKDQIERVTRLVHNARGLRQRYQPTSIAMPLTVVRAGLEVGTCDEDFDWAAIVGGDIRTIVLPATHDSIIHMPHVEAIAMILAEKMACSSGPHQ